LNKSNIDLRTSSRKWLWERHHVQRLCTISSALDVDPDSGCDLNLLVEFAPGAYAGLSFFELEATLSELLQRRVGLYTLGFIRPEIRADVVATAEVQYDAGQ